MLKNTYKINLYRFLVLALSWGLRLCNKQGDTNGVVGRVGWQGFGGGETPVMLACSEALRMGL